jgi:hypothetical protein
MEPDEVGVSRSDQPGPKMPQWVAEQAAQGGYQIAYGYGHADGVRSTEEVFNGLLEEVLKRNDGESVDEGDFIDVLGLPYDIQVKLHRCKLSEVRNLVATPWNDLLGNGFSRLEIAVVQLVLQRFGLRLKDDERADFLRNPPKPMPPGGFIGGSFGHGFGPGSVERPYNL